MSANNDNAVEISEKEFDETVNSKEKSAVVVDFYADWCMPCLMVSPIVEELAGKLKKIRFAKVNVDENANLSARFNVSSIPCIIIFKEGKEVERIIGSLPADVLEEKISKYGK